MRTRLRWFPAAIVLICSFELFVGILPAQQQKAAAPQGIDALTAPIALYPDALVAQVLDASTNPAEVQDFSNWLKQNTNLKGSELQEAASKAGFDAAFIATGVIPGRDPDDGPEAGLDQTTRGGVQGRRARQSPSPSNTCGSRRKPWVT